MMTTSTDYKTIKDFIDQIPDKVSGAAKACHVSERAVYKWLTSGRLPRTDYTGETNYAEQLAKVSGGKFSAEMMRERLLQSHAA